MTAVRVRISTFEYKDPRFGWYELFADQTDLGSSDVEAYASHNAIFFADSYLHANLNGGETWYYWVRAVFDHGDTVGALTFLGSLTLAGGDTDSDGSGGSDDDSAFEPAKTLNGINTQTASYTLVIGDAGLLVEMNVGSANNLTVPPNSSVAFATDTRVDLVQLGAGQTTIVAGAGVTIRSSGARLKLAGQYSGATLYKRAADEWVLCGDIAT